MQLRQRHEQRWTPTFWEDNHQELADPDFTGFGSLALQPEWDVPQTIAIHGAASAWMADGYVDYPATIDEYVAALTDVIEGGACGLHLDYLVVDNDGRRLDKKMPVVEAYRNRTAARALRLELRLRRKRLRRRSLRGLPCACRCWTRRHLADLGRWPPAFFVPASKRLNERFGSWVRNMQNAAQHLFLMTDRIKSVDQDSVIVVRAAGPATTCPTTFATMLGLHIRIGTEDTVWRAPNRGEPVSINREMLNQAIQVAHHLGREPPSADEWRRLLESIRSPGSVMRPSAVWVHSPARAAKTASESRTPSRLRGGSVLERQEKYAFAMGLSAGP